MDSTKRNHAHYFLVVYFTLLVFNVNGVLGVLLGNLGILTPILTLMGGVSFLIVLPELRMLFKHKVLKRLLMFLLFYMGFGLIISYSFPDRHEAPAKLALDISLKTIFIVIPVFGLFHNWLKREAKGKVIKYVFFMMFTATLSIPFFKLIGLSFEVLTLDIEYYSRYSGIWGNANIATFYTNFTLILACYLRLIEQLSKRIFLLTSFLLLCSIFLTFSTTGFFIFTVSIILYLYFKSKKEGKQFLSYIKYGVLGIIAILLAQNFLESSIKGDTQFNSRKVNNLINIISFNFGELDSSGRSDMLDKALPIISQNIISGNGLGYFSVKRFDDLVMHNYFLSVLGEVGILGFLFFLRYLGTFVLMYRSNNENSINFVLLASFLFFSLSFASGAGVLGNPNMLIYSVIASVISYTGYKKSEKFNVNKSKEY